MWRLLTNNIGLKLLSLTIAVGLWLTLVGEPELSTSVTVPVEYKNLPRDLEVSSDIQEHVRLDLTGPPAKLRANALANAAAVIDLSEVQRPGERSFTLDQSSMRMPVGLQLLRSVPAQVRLKFETRLSKPVAVQVRLSGAPAAGYFVESAKATPAQAQIVGPQTDVASTTGVETDLVDINGVTTDVIRQTHLFVDKEQVRFASQPVVSVHVTIRRGVRK